MTKTLRKLNKSNLIVYAFGTMLF